MPTATLYTFASVREHFQESREIEVWLEKSDWSSGNKLKLHIISLLQERRSHRQVTLSSGTHQEDAIDPESLMLALNEEYVSISCPLTITTSDTLALIPPVTGG